MTSWRPQTDFEHEIVSLQPEYNFIYGDLTDSQRKLENGYQPRPPAHLEFMKAKRKADARTENDEMHSNGLHTLRNVHKMLGTKPLGTTTTFEDLDDTENLDRETVAMIRHCGMGPSADLPLNERITIPTLPIPNDIRIVCRGRRKFPVIFDDKYFEMTSTRMRNAKLVENVNAIANSVNEIEIVEKKPEHAILAVLNEPEVKEPTEAEKAAKEFQDSLTAYPLLGSDKKRRSRNGKTATKSVQKDLKATLKPSQTKNKEISDSGKSANNNRNPGRKNSWGSSSSLSFKGSSSYSDCNSFRSENNCNSSTYETAQESLSWPCESSSSKNISGFSKQNAPKSAYKNGNE